MSRRLSEELQITVETGKMCIGDLLVKHPQRLQRSRDLLLGQEVNLHQFMSQQDLQACSEAKVISELREQASALPFGYLKNENATRRQEAHEFADVSKGKPRCHMLQGNVAVYEAELLVREYGQVGFAVNKKTAFGGINALGRAYHPLGDIYAMGVNKTAPEWTGKPTDTTAEIKRFAAKIYRYMLFNVVHYCGDFFFACGEKASEIPLPTGFRAIGEDGPKWIILSKGFPSLVQAL